MDFLPPRGFEKRFALQTMSAKKQIEDRATYPFGRRIKHFHMAALLWPITVALSHEFVVSSFCAHRIHDEIVVLSELQERTE